MLVGLQLTSVQRTEIVLSRSTAKTITNPVIIPVDSPSQSSDAVSDVHSISDVQSGTGGIDYMMYDLCTCGSSGRAHKRDCFRRRRLPQ